MKEAATALEIAQHAGEVLVSAIVYSELSARFTLQMQLDEALLDLDITVRPLDAGAAFEAGQAFGAYLKRGGTRQRILANFSDWSACSIIRKRLPDTRCKVLSSAICLAKRSDAC